MTQFPVQYSTLSSTHLQNHLAIAYGIQDLKCKFHLRGVSDTYKVTSGKERYIFRVYRSTHRSLVEIKGEVQLLRILKDNGAKVSFPCADKNNGYIQEFQAPEGMRYGILFSFAEGRSVYQLSPEQNTIVAQEMARNHNITANLKLDYPRLVYDFHTTMEKPLKLVREDFIDFKDGYNYLVTTARSVIEKLEQLGHEKFSYGYCHYDYLPKNFHFDAQNHFTLFDFDFAGEGYLANDIASYSVHLYLSVAMKKLTLEQAKEDFKNFVLAYRKVRALSDNEIQAIPCLGFMFWLFYFGFHHESFDDFSNIFYTPNFLRERVNTIKKYLEVMPAICNGIS